MMEGELREIGDPTKPSQRGLFLNIEASFGVGVGGKDHADEYREEIGSMSLGVSYSHPLVTP